MELTNEEQLTTQRFDVVIIWSSEVSRLSAEKLQVLLADGVREIDPEATIDVDEMEEPTY